MTVIVNDTFTEVSNTPITSHTPDTQTAGSGYVSPTAVTAIEVREATDRLECVVAFNLGDDSYARIDDATTVLPVDGRIRFKYKYEKNSGNSFIGVMFRTSKLASTGNDGYGFRILGNSDVRIYEYTDIENDVILGTPVSAVLDSTAEWFVQITMNGDNIELGMWSDNWEGSSAHPGSPWSFLDSNFRAHQSGTANSGVGFASLNAAVSANHWIDDFEFDDLAASGQTVTMTVEDLGGATWNNLTDIRWSFFNESDPSNLLAPSDQGITETTDGSGQIILDLPNTTLTTGQTGFLILRHNANNLIGAYRVQID